MSLFKELQHKPFVMAGPCIIESEEMALDLAGQLKAICERQGFTYIFKASFDKANRTSVSSFRGEGMEFGLRVFRKIKEQYNVPVVTDIHESWQAEKVAEVVDVLQIPAFLCRQTDLLMAAGATGKVINVKKAQFLSAADMKNVVSKLESTGNKNLMLCERGSMYGFNNLVVDYTGVLEMKEYGYPVVMDCTHAVQKPGGLGGKTGGNREYVPYIAKAAAAVGVKGFFFEVHRNPEEALSDGPNMVYLDKFEEVLVSVKKVMEAVQ